MGLKAPPALAAIITKPNRNHFDFVFSTILLIIATITMAVVRLSRNADKQKVRIEIAHTNPEILFGLIPETKEVIFQTVNGYLFTQENRQILVSIVGFYFGSAAAGNKT